MRRTEHTDSWLRALRSGDYVQCQGYMKRVNDDGTIGYCCLGVGHDLLGGEFHRDEDFDIEVYGVDVGDSEEEITMSYLPDDEADALGLDRDDQDALAGMNDSGQDFIAIAAYIERSVNGVDEPS